MRGMSGVKMLELRLEGCHIGDARRASIIGVFVWEEVYSESAGRLSPAAGRCLAVPVATGDVVDVLREAHVVENVDDCTCQKCWHR
jgi:hypothetical protein